MVQDSGYKTLFPALIKGIQNFPSSTNVIFKSLLKVFLSIPYKKLKNHKWWKPQILLNQSRRTSDNNDEKKIL